MKNFFLDSRYLSLNLCLDLDIFVETSEKPNHNQASKLVNPDSRNPIN